MEQCCMLKILNCCSLAVIFFACIGQPLLGQQVSDDGFNPAIASPTYTLGKGPTILLDEGHHNFHTLEGRYSTFAKVLKADGYLVGAHKGFFTEESLKEADIVVIANALHTANVANWAKPIHSAFTDTEIAAVRKWVEQGGALFLIADHMPFPGAASDLAQAFGFGFLDGFARDTLKIARRDGGPDVFSLREGTLSRHIAVQGRGGHNSVDSVATFGGQAFRIPSDAVSLITLPDRFHILLPDTAWRFNPGTSVVSGGGLSQLAALRYGAGRIVISGEAAMFSAQLSGQNRQPMGLNHPSSRQNITLLLNLIHWLDRY